jgi:hypothetical protein
VTCPNCAIRAGGIVKVDDVDGSCIYCGAENFMIGDAFERFVECGWIARVLAWLFVS